MEESASGQSAGSSNADGHEFGVHITINPPHVPEKGAAPNNANQERAVNQGMAEGQDTRQAVGKQPARQEEQEAASAPDAAQQARQAAVQHMLGEDGSEQQAETAAGADTPWPMAGNQLSFMTFLPFMLVFLAAFITFTLRNMGKKRGSLPKTARKNDVQRTRAAPEQGGGISLGNTGRDTAENEDKTRGRNFEMRI